MKMVFSQRTGPRGFSRRDYRRRRNLPRLLCRGGAKLSDGVSVDANVMALFAKSFLPNKGGETKVAEAKQLIDGIRSTIGFAVDTGRKIEHQWSTTCGWKAGNPFREWFV